MHNQIISRPTGRSRSICKRFLFFSRTLTPDIAEVSKDMVPLMRYWNNSNTLYFFPHHAYYWQRYCKTSGSRVGMCVTVGTYIPSIQGKKFLSAAASPEMVDNGFPKEDSFIYMPPMQEKPNLTAEHSPSSRCWAMRTLHASSTGRRYSSFGY